MGSSELPVRQRGECCEVAVPLSEARAQEAAALLRALADPTRLRIVTCLADSRQPVCICDLTATFDLSQPTISHHMAKLKAAGLVRSHKQGIWIFYRLSEDLPETAAALLDAMRRGRPAHLA